MHIADPEFEIRQAAFRFLDDLVAVTGGAVTFDQVSQFSFGGQRIPLLDAGRGIRKPASMRAALSIRTVFAATPDARPYADEPGPDGLERYKWRGNDPNHPENRALRTALAEQLPCIWFLGVAQGQYHPVYPVWLVDEEPDQQQFVVAIAESQRLAWRGIGDAADVARYGSAVVKTRLHQPVFRTRVLLAYAGQCAICRLRHAELLDAAHIRSDAAGGVPSVTNGIAMCKLHHAAYDNHLIGVRDDYQIEVRSDLLLEVDGPTLRHSIQEMHGSSMQLPSRRSARPDREALAERFEAFRTAG